MSDPAIVVDVYGSKDAPSPIPIFRSAIAELGPHGHTDYPTLAESTRRKNLVVAV